MVERNVAVDAAIDILGPVGAFALGLFVMITALAWMAAIARVVTGDASSQLKVVIVGVLGLLPPLALVGWIVHWMRRAIRQRWEARRDDPAGARADSESRSTRRSQELQREVGSSAYSTTPP